MNAAIWAKNSKLDSLKPFSSRSWVSEITGVCSRLHLGLGVSFTVCLKVMEYIEVIFFILCRMTNYYYDKFINKFLRR